MHRELSFGYKVTRCIGPSNVRLMGAMLISEPIAAAHNDRLVTNGYFAIRYPTFVPWTVNGYLGSVSALELADWCRRRTSGSG